MHMYFFWFSGEEDSRLYFTNGSPRVDGNTVSADFVVGNSFTSVLCQITTRTTPVDCKSCKQCYMHRTLYICHIHITLMKVLEA